jgi:hypothetical protein
LIHLLVYAFPLANWLFSPTLSEKFLLWEMGVEPVVGWIDSYYYYLLLVSAVANRYVIVAAAVAVAVAFA